MHRIWTTEEGLPQNMVNDILQTRDGYLWLATFGGLGRFDGHRFTVFNIANTEGLGSNRILSLHEDREGALWMGLETGELARFHQGVFSTYEVDEGLPGGVIWSIVEDREGNLWIGGAGGLGRLTDGRFRTYTVADGLPANWVTSLLVDRVGDVWIGTRGGLGRYSAGRFTVYTTDDGLPDRRVRALFEDHVGNLWVGTKNGLARHSEGRFTAYPSTSQPIVSIRSIAEDRAGNLWISTGGALVRLEVATAPGGERLRSAVYPFDAFTYGDFPIWSIFQDQEDNLWVGIRGQGLSRLRKRAVMRYTTRDGLPNPQVLPITSDGEGGLWIGSGCTGGVTRYQSGTFTLHQANDRKIQCPRALLRDRKGVLWIGHNEVMTRYQDGTYTHYTKDDGLPPGVVRALFEDRVGTLWVGFQGGGVARFQDDVFTPYTTHDGLLNDHVVFITQDRRGALWFGTQKGLSRFENDVFTNFSTQDGLSPGMVRAIHEDEDGTLWIGTYGGGLSRLKEGIFTRYTMDDGLFDNVISRILEDDRGNLWMNGNLGLFYVSRKALNDFADGAIPSIECVSFGPGDGMAEGNGGGQPAGWKTPDGKMWFPTIDGLVVVDPAHLNINNVPPPVVIEQVFIDDVQFDLEHTLEATQGRGDLEVRYAALSFSRPGRVRYKYRLEGYDEDWVDAGDRRVAYYTSLPHGDYRFGVIASNDYGVWNEEGASVRVTIHPPWWRKTWAYIVYGLLFATGLFATSRFQRRHVLQKAHAQARIREAQLKAENAEIRAIGQVATGITHDLRNPLAAVLNAATFLGRRVPENEPKWSKHVGIIKREVKTAAWIIDDLMEMSRGKQPNKQVVDLFQAAREIHNRVLDAHGIEFSCRAEPEPFEVYVDPDQFRRVLDNLVTNAVQAMEGRGEIRVEAVHDGQFDVITVQDEGPGIAEQEREQVFEPLYTTRADGTGLGLAISRQIIERHGGTLDFAESKGPGAVFRIRLPRREATDEAI